METKTISELIEFIKRHELDEDTEINISYQNRVHHVTDMAVATRMNGVKIKPQLILMEGKQ